MYNNNGMYVVDGNNAEEVFAQDIREHKRANSGFWGQVKAKSSRKNMDLSHVMAKAIPMDMVVRRADGVSVTIPADWFTKTGKIRKGRKDQYKALLGL